MEEGLQCHLRGVIIQSRGLPTNEDFTSPEKDGAKCKFDTSTVIYPVLAPVSSQRPPQQASGGAQSAADAARFHFVYPEGSRTQCMVNRSDRS
jgi:hypothetical protein